MRKHIPFLYEIAMSTAYDLSCSAMAMLPPAGSGLISRWTITLGHL